MEKPVEGTNEDHNHLNWSERVEDLLASGDSEQAIALLESVVLKLETLAHSETADLLLASALTDLAKLYSSRSFSLKSDELLSRASVLKQRAIRNRHSSAVQNVEEDSIKEDEASSSGVGLDCNNLSVFVDGHRVRSSTSTVDPNYEGTPDDGAAEDDWEAIVDRDPNELVSSQCLPGVSNLTLEETKSQTPKRRGRGTFAYEKHELYSEQPVDYSLLDDVKTENASSLKENNTPLKHSKYGTKHVLVLANFSPTMRTIDLENLFQEFRDHGFAIRWVNDTTALAVFRTPSIALEAFNSVQCPFTVHILDENDILMSSISSRDLEPPCQRPQTSVRTARRLIAHGMGLKLSSTSFGSRELKSQEEARKNRITMRQKLRDDAWGDE